MLMPALQRDRVDRERLAAQAGERGARVGEGVDADAEPRHAVAAGDADQAEEQDDRDLRIGVELLQHAEVEHHDHADEDLEDQDELALRDQIGLARLVNQLGDLAASSACTGRFFSCVKIISPNSRPSAQTTRPPISSVRPLMPLEVDAADRSGSTRLASPPRVRARPAAAGCGRGACAARGARRPAPATQQRRRQQRPSKTVSTVELDLTSRRSGEARNRYMTSRQPPRMAERVRRGLYPEVRRPDRRRAGPGCGRQRHPAGQKDADALLDGDVGKARLSRSQITMSPRYR